MRVLLLVLLLTGCASGQPTKTDLTADESATFNTGEKSEVGVNAGMGAVKSFWFMRWPIF